MDPTTARRPPVHVAAIPYPGRGHVNPMLNLCRSLVASSRNSVTVSVVVTEEWARLIGAPSTSAEHLRFVTIPNVVPSERTRGADMGGFFRCVLADMRGPVEAAIARMQPPADFVLSDAMLPWAGDMCKLLRIPAVALWTSSAAVLLALLRLASSDGQGAIEEDRALAYLPSIASPQLAGIASRVAEHAALRGLMQMFQWFTTAHALLLASPYELESQAIDTLKSDLSLPIYTAGPCIPWVTAAGNDPEGSCFKWLDAQPDRSVLYVSLGSFLSATGEQLDEMVLGLKASGTRYLLVARDENQRLKELDEELGMVVPWCEQLRVLCHPAVGGFLTHCGWNSTMEAVYAGTPMLTYPLIWDQYPNSRFMVDDLKIGLRLRVEDQEGRVTGREEVVGMVKGLMDLEGEDGKERRRRAEELKVQCRRSVGEGGSSCAGLDALVQVMISTKKKN